MDEVYDEIPDSHWESLGEQRDEAERNGEITVDIRDLRTAQKRIAQLERELAARPAPPVVVLTGDTGGGRREFGIHVGGRDLGGFGYQDCGWAFQDHKPIIRDLAEALGAQVDDRTT
ncbi:hypothetical protein JCM9534A_00220 [Catenuloplanes indicus JCM 9534]